jgi:hypothetical protein
MYNIPNAAWGAISNHASDTSTPVGLGTGFSAMPLRWRKNIPCMVFSIAPAYEELRQYFTSASINSPLRASFYTGMLDAFFFPEVQSVLVRVRTCALHLFGDHGRRWISPVSTPNLDNSEPKLSTHFHIGRSRSRKELSHDHGWPSGFERRVCHACPRRGRYLRHLLGVQMPTVACWIWDPEWKAHRQAPGTQSRGP